MRRCTGMIRVGIERMEWRTAMVQWVSKKPTLHCTYWAEEHRLVHEVFARRMSLQNILRSYLLSSRSVTAELVDIDILILCLSFSSIRQVSSDR